MRDHLCRVLLSHGCRKTIEVLVIALAHGVQWIGGIVLDIPISPLFFVIELGLGILLIVLYRRSSKGILLPNL